MTRRCSNREREHDDPYFNFKLKEHEFSVRNEGDSRFTCQSQNIPQSPLSVLWPLAFSILDHGHTFQDIQTTARWSLVITVPTRKHLKLTCSVNPTSHIHSNSPRMCYHTESHPTGTTKSCFRR